MVFRCELLNDGKCGEMSSVLRQFTVQSLHSFRFSLTLVLSPLDGADQSSSLPLHLPLLLFSSFLSLRCPAGFCSRERLQGGLLKEHCQTVALQLYHTHTHTETHRFAAQMSGCSQRLASWSVNCAKRHISSPSQ